MSQRNRKLSGNHVISKHNTLNALRPNDMTLQELRFFSIYLGKINPLDESTRVVKFSLSDFKAIIDLKSAIKINDIKTITRRLLQKIVEMPNEHAAEGGYVSFQLFKECELSKNENEEWYVSIDAHDRALPYMFQFKGHYFKYGLWNTLRLKSRNQLRMYEILKQYENIGYRIVSVADLKGWLGIGGNEYTRFGDFKADVLDVCQEALIQYTDIAFTYEPYGKKGRGGKINQLKFNITKNKDYVDPLGLERFIDLKAQTAQTAQTDVVDAIDADESETGVNNPVYRARIEFLSDACDNRFSFDEMREISLLLLSKNSQFFSDAIKCHDYLKLKFMAFQRYEKRENGIKRPFNYFRTIIENDA